MTITIPLYVLKLYVLFESEVSKKSKKWIWSFCFGRLYKSEAIGVIYEILNESESVSHDVNDVT